MTGKIVTLTEAAAEHAKDLLARAEGRAFGLRIGLDTKGCMGLSYSMEYATEKDPMDEVVEDKGVTIFVDPKATMFLIGCEIDYVEDKLQSGFVFNNPNEKGRCGCGESFQV
jgi:iron-sulfur cluster assembly protein